MLPVLYQKHLKKQLSESQFLLMNLLINVLQESKNVNLEKIATALPIPILFESRRKKLQRFLSLPIINIQDIWFPIIQEWLAQSFNFHQNIYLAIDRTNWERKNLMVISIIFDKRAIPVYFELLTKLGSSNLDEQKRVITKILPLLENYKTVLLGDREFCSVQLANWLREQGLDFCLRLKKNENIELEDNLWCQLKNLGLKPGTSLFIQDVKVTKSQQIRGFNVACKWGKHRQSQVTKEGWFILTSLSSKDDAISAYKLRFGIEEMFRDFKSGGYNLEDTNLESYRFISAVLIISLAYSLATFQGKAIKNKGVQKYLARVKETGRVYRRHSSFYIGLYGQNWMLSMDNCWSLVQDLMRLNRHKLEYYLRGMRAMELIQSAF